MKRINLYLHEDMLEKLKSRAKETGKKGYSEIIRQSIGEYFFYVDKVDPDLMEKAITLINIVINNCKKMRNPKYRGIRICLEDLTNIFEGRLLETNETAKRILNRKNIKFRYRLIREWDYSDRYVPVGMEYTILMDKGRKSIYNIKTTIEKLKAKWENERYV